MKTFLLVLLFTVFTVSARADDIVDLNVQSTWVNHIEQNSESYSFVQSWDLTTGATHLLSFSESGSPMLVMNFNFSQAIPSDGPGGVGFLDRFGDNYQIIAGVYNGEIVNDPTFGTPGTYTQAEVDIFCNSDTCRQEMKDGFIDGEATSYNISITQASPISTPEISSGASLAAGLLLSSAFILYNRRRKANLDRAI